MLADLPGNVRQTVLHEPGQLGRMIDAEECMQMIAQDCQGEDSDTEQVLRASEDAENEVIGSWIRTEKKPASDSANGNLYN